jgi:hypothetical protein
MHKLKNRNQDGTNPEETHFKYKDINRLKLSQWKKIYHANVNQMKTGSTCINFTTDFRARKITWEKRGIA